jgi:hypothetical protein
MKLPKQYDPPEGWRLALCSILITAAAMALLYWQNP